MLRESSIEFGARLPFRQNDDRNFRFEFAEKDGGTEVTWSMDSSLPFFLFFMKRMMETFIGMDYTRGLAMLKDYAENGEVPSKLEFPGPTSFAGSSYVGINRACSMEEMPKFMGDDFDKLKEWLAGSGSEASGKPFSIYHKWDPIKKLTQYTVGVPVASVPGDLPASFCSGEIPSCQVYDVKHTGHYEHLANAWSAGYMHARSKQFRQNKSIPPFETYETDPDEVSDRKDLVTVVHFPMK